MEYRRLLQITPEIEVWRDRGPLKKWLDQYPKMKRARRLALREQFGISRQHMNNWVNGVSLPKLHDLVKLCAMIRCAPRRFIEWFNQHPVETDRCAASF